MITTLEKYYHNTDIDCLDLILKSGEMKQNLENVYDITGESLEDTLMPVCFTSLEKLDISCFSKEVTIVLEDITSYCSTLKISYNPLDYIEKDNTISDENLVILRTVFRQYIFIDFVERYNEMKGKMSKRLDLINLLQNKLDIFAPEKETSVYNNIPIKYFTEVVINLDEIAEDMLEVMEDCIDFMEENCIEYRVV